MIQVTRSIIRQFRAIFKKSVGLHCLRSIHPPVVLKTDANGLTIHAQFDGIAVSFHVDGLLPAEQIVLPSRALEDFDGREQSNVELQYTAPSKVLARWTDRGVPCAVEYELAITDTALDLPGLPDKFTENDAGLLKALDDAMHTVSGDTVRFATNKVQLRGSGEIVATDGRQLLWQSGFQFPWTDDFLVPHVKAFGCAELKNEKSVAIGKMAKYVCIRVGNWTFFLPIDKEGRFPKVENVIPKLNSNSTHLQVNEQDAAFLAKTLPRLPGNDDDSTPITLDLNGQVVVRARGVEQERSTEAILSHSQATGSTIRYSTNRIYLARALALGFSEVHFVNADTPALCQDERRKYVFMGLGKDSVRAPTDNDLRISSDTETSSIPPTPIERTEPTMKTTPQSTEPETATNGNGQHTNGETQNENGHHKSGTFGVLLEEAQSVQNILRDALLRTNQLLGGLKQYRRQAKAMNSTLASLRQLQEVEA